MAYNNEIQNKIRSTVNVANFLATKFGLFQLYVDSERAAGLPAARPSKSVKNRF